MQWHAKMCCWAWLPKLLHILSHPSNLPRSARTPQNHIDKQPPSGPVFGSGPSNGGTTGKCHACQLNASGVVPSIYGTLGVDPNHCMPSANPNSSVPSSNPDHHQRPMSLAMLFLLQARHAVKHNFWGPVLAAVVEQLGLLALAAQAWMAAVAQPVLSWLVASEAPVAAFVLVLSWPALSPLVVVPAADIGSPTAVEAPVAVVLVEPREQHAWLAAVVPWLAIAIGAAVVPWLRHSPAVAKHQWPLRLGTSVCTVPLHGPVGWTQAHI